MKKILFVILVIFFLCGCEAEYSIDLDKNFLETINCISNDASEFDDMQKKYYPYPAIYDPDYFEEENKFLSTDIDRYNISVRDSIIYSYKFCGDYSDSNVANLATVDFEYMHPSLFADTAGIYAKDFIKVFNKYPNLKKLTINVKSSKEGFEDSHNADFVNGNVYTWIITRDNPNREIYYNYIATYSEDDEYSTCKDENGGRNNNIPSGQSNTKPDVKPSNNENEKNTNTANNNTLLYILYTLFFGLIFVIIIFRNKFNKR